MGYVFDAVGNHFLKTINSANGLPQLMWHITNQCGLYCKFCFSRKEKQELDITKLQAYVSKFVQLGVQKVDISGGEPLEYPYLKEVCEALHASGIYITLTTRGIGRAENVRWVLENRNIFIRIIVSADVPTSRLFESLSGGAHDFDTMQQFVLLLKDLKYTGLRINTVVTRLLLDDEVFSGMIAWVRESGCREWCLIEPHPANKKVTFDQVSVQSNEYNLICDKVKQMMVNGPKVLVRYAANFSGYWVIYPDGILAKHTSTEKDVNEMKFMEVPVDEIIRQVDYHELWIPEGE